MDTHLATAPAEPAHPKPVPSATPWPGARRRLHRRLVLALVVLAGAGAIGTWWMRQATDTVRYVTAAVERGPITRVVTATGTVNPELTIIVGSYVSGVIQELRCDYNTEVTAGQVCAKIDPRPYQTQVSQSAASLAVAKAQLDKDKAELTYRQLAYERQRWLVERQSASVDARDLAKSLYDQARAQVAFDQATIAQREAALAAAEVNLGYTDIVSPVSGTVVSRNVTVGQTVAASFQTPTLFLIASDLTRMQIDTNVSESDIGGIKVGNPVRFTVDAFPGQVFEGAVSQVRQSPQTVQNVVTYDVVVAVANRALLLKPGMTAATRIVIDQRTEVLRVPNQALRYAPGGLAGAGGAAPDARGRDARTRTVWVRGEICPVRIAVETGLEDDSHTEIVAGELRLEDTVIVAEDGTGRACHAPVL